MTLKAPFAVVDCPPLYGTGVKSGPAHKSNTESRPQRKLPSFGRTALLAHHIDSEIIYRYALQQSQYSIFVYRIE